MPLEIKRPLDTAAISRGSETIIFIHPDLGIGGAERLIVDAAVGLQELGHRVVIYTSHCDRSHCFDEARDGTLDVRVRVARWLPASLFGRFHILFATLRQLYLLLTISFPPPLAFFSKSAELSILKPDTFIVDQLSAGLPLLRWLWIKKRILFYCHFPDQLLVQKEKRTIMKLVKTPYRLLFDRIETWTMQAADKVVVNSEFTRNVAYQTLGRITAGSYAEFVRDWGIIYPCVNVSVAPGARNANGIAETASGSEANESEKQNSLWPPLKVFLSINRFERKKGIELAIEAFAKLKEPLGDECRLVLAGGYDSQLRENSQYHNDLVAVCEKLGLSHATARTVPTALAIPNDIRVLFLLSVPSSFKSELLSSSKLLLYTPQNEHFGIVPVEAMDAGLPVLASNSGGPLESIVEGKTGWLRSVDDSNAWSEVMQRVLELGSTSEGQRKLSQIAVAGKERARNDFGRDTMSRRFEQEIRNMWQSPRKDFADWRDILQAISLVGVVFCATAVYVMQSWIRQYSQKKTG